MAGTIETSLITMQFDETVPISNDVSTEVVDTLTVEVKRHWLQRTIYRVTDGTSEEGGVGEANASESSVRRTFSPAFKTLYDFATATDGELEYTRRVFGARMQTHFTRLLHGLDTSQNAFAFIPPTLLQMAWCVSALGWNVSREPLQSEPTLATALLLLLFEAASRNISYRVLPTEHVVGSKRAAEYTLEVTAEAHNLTKTFNVTCPRSYNVTMDVFRKNGMLESDERKMMLCAVMLYGPVDQRPSRGSFMEAAQKVLAETPSTGPFQTSREAIFTTLNRPPLAARSARKNLLERWGPKKQTRRKTTNAFVDHTGVELMRLEVRGGAQDTIALVGARRNGPVQITVPHSTFDGGARIAYGGMVGTCRSPEGIGLTRTFVSFMVVRRGVTPLVVDNYTIIQFELPAQ